MEAGFVDSVMVGELSGLFPASSPFEASIGLQFMRSKFGLGVMVGEISGWFSKTGVAL